MQKFMLGFAIFLVVAGFAGYKAYSIYTEVKSAVAGGPIEGPKSGGWDQLKEGISVKEAQSLLGEGMSVETTSGDTKTTYLAYTYTDGALASPSPKGHNLWFENDKLIKWTKPGDKIETEAKIVLTGTSETPETTEESKVIETKAVEKTEPAETTESPEESKEPELKAE